MKRKLVIISFSLAMLFGIGYKDQIQAHTTFSFNLFFDALAPFGNWISMPDYGYAWQPTDVGPNWRPYTSGQWVWTDYGWTWVSYEPWGWAPYHYGRWVFTDDYGWVWIPGTVWAPAWVTWYTGSGYIGWAPLPPDNNFFLQIGIGPIGFNYYTRPSYCVFVPTNSFLYSNINSVVIPQSQNITIIKNTTNINNITSVNNRVINNGPGMSIVERATGVRVQKVHVEERNIDPHTVTKGGANINKLEGKNFYVFRPSVVRRRDETPHLLKREPVKRGEINQPNVYKGEEIKPSNQWEFKKKGGELNQPPVYKEGEVNKPPKQQELKKKGGEISQPHVYKGEEFGNPSKQQGFQNKPVLKGGESNRPTTQEKKKEIKPSQQIEQKKKEEQ